MKIDFFKNILLILIFFILFLLNIKNIFAASFEFEPAFTTFTKCKNTIKIMIDATGEDTNAADIEIFYDPTHIKIIDQNTSLAKTQIISGNAFQKYWGNITDESLGQILLAGGSIPNPFDTLTSKKIFAEIEFKYTGPGGATEHFEIRFDGLGNTLDSNIANTINGDDLLSSVVNATFTFKTNNKCLSTVPTPYRTSKSKRTDIPYPSDREYETITSKPIASTIPKTVTASLTPWPELSKKAKQTFKIPASYKESIEKIITKKPQTKKEKWLEVVKPRFLENVSTSELSLCCCCILIHIVVFLFIIVIRRRKQKNYEEKEKQENESLD